MNTSELNRHFAIDGIVKVVDVASAYPLIQITNPHATASIALHGAQVLSYRPKGQEPLLWVSKDAVYSPGVSVRGGIPICWPWFGAHPDVGMPAHGFVRNRFWQLRSLEQLGNQSTQLVLATCDDQDSLAFWPAAFELQLTVNVGAALSLALTMTHGGSAPISITAALHSYFAVGDIHRTTVRGLENVEYIDALLGFQRFTQAGAIHFDAELDRIYQYSSADEYIQDELLRRRIRLQKRNSESSVVWNPWIAKSSRMSDFEQDGYRRMLCVETANAADDAVTLAPGESHTLGVEISIDDNGC